MAESNIWLPPSYEIYVKPTEIEMSRRKLEGLNKLAEIQNWGRRRPDKFINEFIGFELLDVQEYILMNSWTTPNCLWLESRGSGKSTMLEALQQCLYNRTITGNTLETTINRKTGKAYDITVIMDTSDGNTYEINNSRSAMKVTITFNGRKNVYEDSLPVILNK